ncbi:MAG: GNAT family N-acetyltransferase [Pseudomonadota bacterium]
MAAALSPLLAPLEARVACEADVEFLARLYASTRTDLQSATADPALVASIIGMQQRLQGAGYRRDFPQAAYLVLEQAAVPCGRIVVDAGSSALRLVDIALLPDRRGQGLGRHILGALQGCATAGGLPLTLAVHHANPRARRLYVALGFESVSRDDVAEQMVWRPQAVLPSVVKSAKGVR